MNFIADLHVHSHYSISTAKNLDLENLYIAARMKGIHVVATGDCTHPGWLAEIKEKLVPAEEGLFRLKDEIASQCDQAALSPPSGPVRFILESEISSIYKKDSRVRKNHNLVFFPDLETAERFNAKLDKIGNIKSDGRPILGLDAKHLLELLLETTDHGFLIPAHIWTPWFSLLGSKSGFDCIEECFEDLTPHIFALETGLSSDPAMNWRVSGLDGRTLVSNSDAHSPANLGREANLFNTELSFSAIKKALQSGDPRKFLGTFEFYPEEGKYHLDGHRKCQVCLEPRDSLKTDCLCPACGKPLTLGVLYRVEQLADRPEDVLPDQHHPFYSIIPLKEILSEILGVGPKSKKVHRHYETALKELGTEFDILHAIAPEAIDTAGIPLLSEAVRRMRNGKVFKSPGYDGEYGHITMFAPGEIARLRGQKTLFGAPKDAPRQKKTQTGSAPQMDFPKNDGASKTNTSAPSQTTSPAELLANLDSEQRRAVTDGGRAIMIIAGPGAGKTRTLTHRIAYLVLKRQVKRQRILAVTFTNKAAAEMRERIRILLHGSSELPRVDTFHGLCLALLKEQGLDQTFTLVDDHDRKALAQDVIRQANRRGLVSAWTADRLLDHICAAKQQILSPQDGLNAVVKPFEEPFFKAAYALYQRMLTFQGLCDYEDLIFNVVRLLETDPVFLQNCRNRFQALFVDEYQDLNQGQHRILQALAPPADICVIGDPNQSIYGFSGADPECFHRFAAAFPYTRVFRLNRNYRSAPTIQNASHQVIRPYQRNSPKATEIVIQERDSLFKGERVKTFSTIQGSKTITIMRAVSARAEAVMIGKTIERMVGGLGFHTLDYGQIEAEEPSQSLAFADFAVLYRSRVQSAIIADVFAQANIPFQIASKINLFYCQGIAELMALLKITQGTGSYTDFEKIANCLDVRVGKKAARVFKAWGLDQETPLADAMERIKETTIDGLNQFGKIKLIRFWEMINDFIVQTADMSTGSKIQFLNAHTGIDKMIARNLHSQEMIAEVIALAREYDRDVDGFLSAAALRTDTDIYKERAEKVALMTMHAAKGLEFPVVFISGCEEGYIPFQKTEAAPADIDEERRLFYVAMTRAQRHLMLTYTAKRTIHGKSKARTIAPFVAAIEARLLAHEKAQNPKKNPKAAVQLQLF